jgi:7-cyano-7-deazaguanine synthase in queuosine biosynthesis
MQDKRLILCGNPAFDVPADLAGGAMRFHLHGADDDHKVTLRIEDIRRSMYSDVPLRFHDLLEIATYVYCADQAWPRGQMDAETFGANWRRHFHFVIPVSDTTFWNSTPAKECLIDVLGFLSDDRYEFDFVGAPSRPHMQGFLTFNERGELLGFPEEVVMFSGGLDSLGGAVEEIVNNKRRVVLVNHRSSTKLDRIYHRLEEKLAAKAPECPLPCHIRVTVHKQKWMNKEYTQRSRSFLFVSLGAAISRMLRLDAVRFYENGVISMNLPFSAQVVGGKATRTTHPRTIAGFQRLLMMVAEGPFRVETPFIWKTKGEVVELIARAGCQDMIGDSISCTHTWELSIDHPHCGTCSQCVDRRFAVLAAGMEAHDPLDRYLVDVFTQCRVKDEHVVEDKTMYAGYLERANQVGRIHDVVRFLVEFPEAARVLSYLPGSPDSVAARIFDMYKRHSLEVNRVVDLMLARHGTAIRQRTLPVDSLMRVVYESHLPVTASAVAQTSEELPESVFRRTGDHWQIRFGGRKAFPLVSVNTGASYINHMLRNPHQPTPVVEIVLGATIEPVEPVLGDSGEVADDQAVCEYRQRARELIDEVEDAKERGDSERVEALDEEMAKVESAISEARGLGGRARKAQSGRERIRKAFQAAVRRCIDKVAETDRDLAKHLRQCIQCGAEPCYRPDATVRWETRPLTID